MFLVSRWLIVAVVCLIGLNVVLGWLVWPFVSPIASSAAAPASSTPVVSPVPRPSTVTSECRTHVNTYLAQSSARMNEYFRLYDEMTADNHLVLADEVMALSEEIAPLPESCPATLDTALHMNYISVYSSAPIHLHRYLSTATDLPRETANQRIAWRYFEREADIAEQSTYQLLRLIQ
jgi:hypothetical protein